MGTTIVTTSHKPDRDSLAAAGEAATFVRASLVERDKTSLAQLRLQHDAENVMVVTRNEVKVYTDQGEYFFHPNMSVPRIKALRQGKADNMVEAMALVPGENVLDCTLGLGADAIVAAFVTGPSGRVVGLESVPEIAYIVRRGLQKYHVNSKFVNQAMDRIEVICAEAGEFLRGQPDNTFDIVYFDPMFRIPLKKSNSIEPLRGLVNMAPLNEEIVKEALRVAGKRVVMKENAKSGEFARLGFSEVVGGRYSPVAFGIMEKRGAGI